MKALISVSMQKHTTGVSGIRFNLEEILFKNLVSEAIPEEANETPGRIAQRDERLIDIQEAEGSIPSVSILDRFMIH